MACTALMALRPAWWLVALPAALPVADLSPWSGWTVVDEFDLIVLAAIAGGYARLSWPRGTHTARAVTTRTAAWSQAMRWVLWLCAVSIAVSLPRGLWAAPELSLDAYASDSNGLNALPIVKGVLFAASLAPLAWRQTRSSPVLAWRRFTLGMCSGITLVLLAVAWERTAYPGALDVDARYRTVALFWEMRVGGSAIDAYLAMAAPFVAWAMASASTGRRWLAASLLALAFEYACLTTFSRGVYLAVGCALVSFSVLHGRQPSRHGLAPAWRRPANRILLCALLLQALFIGSGSFMSARTKLAVHDFGDRLAHWRDAVALLSGAEDWVWGKGLGRFPAEFAAAWPQYVPGSVRFAQQHGEHFAVLGAAPRNAALSGTYALTQRVPMDALGDLRVGFDARAAAAASTLEVSVCELHLLYERHCRRSTVELADSGAQWQHVERQLDGPSLQQGLRFAPRQAVFAVSVLGVGTSVELRSISLRNGSGSELLHNGDFAHGFARWLPAAREYFVPWHVDNLGLELLIEQGLVGVAAFAAFFVLVFQRLLHGTGRGRAATPVLASSLAGAVCVGLTSSVFDMPRTAFLLLLLAVMALALATPGTPAENARMNAC